jgi:hypothetical protein
MIFNALADQGGAGFPWPWNQIQCTGGGVAETKPCTSDANCSSSGLYCDFNNTNRCVTAGNLRCIMDEECPAPYHCGNSGLCTTEAAANACGGVACSDSNLNICSEASNNCSMSQVNAWDTEIRAAASGKSICSGIDTVRIVKAIMAKESGGDISQISPAGAAGLMQLLPSTANYWKVGPYQCAPNENIDVAWLVNPANVQKSICIAIDFMRSLVADCGCNVRQIAAGYNGGGGIIGSCFQSANCGPAAQSSGGECIACQGDTYTRRWECLWDDNQHTICNTGYSETRSYAPQVLYCYGQF